MGLSSKLVDRFKIEFAGQIVSVVSGAVLTIVLARLLNPNEYGLLFLAISVFGVVKFFSEFGIAQSAGRYIAEYKETEPGQIPHILRFSFLLNLGTISLTCIVLILSYEYIADLIGEPALEPFLLLGVLFITFGTVVTYFRRILQGFENIKVSAFLHATDRSSRLIFALGFVLSGYGAIGAFVGYILAFAITSFFGVVYLYVFYRPTMVRTERRPDLRRRIAEYSLPLIMTNTADVLDKRFDTILLGFFLGPIAVGFYTVSKQVVTFIETPMSALGFTLSPTYKTQKEKGNDQIAARIYEQALSHGLLLYIPAAAGIALISEPLIELIFGSDYLGAVAVLQVLSIYAILQSVTKLTSSGLDFIGRARERAIVKGVTAVMNVILNIILIPSLGVVGAAVATVITYSIYTVSCVYIMHTELTLRTKYLLSYLGKILTITAAMSTVVYILVDYISGFLALLAVIGLGVVVWATLAISLGMIDVRKIYSTVS